MKIKHKPTLIFGMAAACFFLLNSCKQKNIFFEDDFESYVVDAPPGMPWEKSGEGIVFIDTTRAFSGKKSVHFISGEDYTNRAFIELSRFFPIPGNNYYGAMKMYVEEASPDGIHWTMIQSAGKVPGEDFMPKCGMEVSTKNDSWPITIQKELKAIAGSTPN